MLRLTIITATNAHTLMVSGALSFQETFQMTTPEALNRAFVITNEFVQRFAQINPCLGFCETKRNVIAKHLHDDVGKYAIITTKWLSTTNLTNRAYLRAIVRCLNMQQPLNPQQSKLLKSYGIATC